ncbi:hypothetical protein ACWGJB_26310 [Streptomyces sp. NPDC054813]
MREDDSVTAEGVLQQVFGEESGRADTEAQRGGQGSVVLALLSSEGVQGAKREQDWGSEVQGSKHAVGQVGLLGTGPGEAGISAQANRLA